MFARGMAFLLLVSLPSLAEEHNASSVKETYQDWRLTCNETGENSVCEIQQMIVNQNKQVVSMISFGPSGDRPKALQIALPHMLDLTQGVQIVIDNNASTVMPFRYCSSQACFVLIPEDSELLDQMKSGTAGIIRARQMGQQQLLQIQFSLMGFTAASSSLGEL